MLRRVGIVALTLVLQTGAVFAAGPFDGNWKGGAPGIGKSCTSADMTMSVADNQVTGTSTINAGKLPITGHIAADGSFAGKVGAIPFTGKFEGDSFQGVFTAGACSGQQMHASLKRVK